MVSSRADYFHKVRVTRIVSSALEALIKGQAGDDVQVIFNPRFAFRIIDRTDPGITRDYGWYADFDETAEKLARMYPLLAPEIQKLIING